MSHETVLSFWFGVPDSNDAKYEQRRKLWFGKKPEFDQSIQTQFLGTYQQAVAGELTSWRSQPFSSLALILVLDQFPRNMFRDTPQAFATDAQALATAKEAIAQGFDQQLQPIHRVFVYLPFEHSEKLEDQLQSVQLYRQLVVEHPQFSDVIDYANRHYEIIRRFGRFPHRNQILGRPTTPEEAEFLKQPGSSF
jgi:uncharacterized protein (DUF924 family)